MVLTVLPKPIQVSLVFYKVSGCQSCGKATAHFTEGRSVQTRCPRRVRPEALWSI